MGFAANCLQLSKNIRMSRYSIRRQKLFAFLCYVTVPFRTLQGQTT